MVLHRHGQKRLGSVAGLFVKQAGTGKIVSTDIVGVFDIDGAIVNHRTGNHHIVVGAAIFEAEGNRCKCRRFARGAAKRDGKRIGAQYLELEHAVFDQIQSTGIGIGQLLSRQQNRFQQAPKIFLARQRNPDLIQPIQQMQQVNIVRHTLVPNAI